MNQSKMLAELRREAFAHEPVELASNGQPFYEPFEDDTPSVIETSTIDKGDDRTPETLGDLVEALISLGAKVREHQGPDFARQVTRELEGLNDWQVMYVGGFLHMAARASLPGFSHA